MSRQGLFQRSQHSQALFAQRREIAPGGPEGHGASRTGASLQYLSAAGDLLTDKEDIQDAQDHRVDWVDSVIKRNHRNQYVLSHEMRTISLRISWDRTYL